MSNPNGTDMYVVWASGNQTQFSNPNDNSTLTGSRAIVFVESHNAGNTWSVPLPIAGARTRSGVSCTFDALRARVVVAFADHVERIHTTNRNPAAVGAGSWTVPSVMTNAFGSPSLRTGDTPMLSFDPYSADNYGLLSWWDSDVNDQRTMYVTRSVFTGNYVHDSGFLPWVTSTVVEEQLLSSVIPNVIFGNLHWALNTQKNTLLGRRRYRYVGGMVSENYDLLAINPTLDIYVGSGANRLLVETAYIRHGMTN